jgi:hypothetical protein
MNLGRENQVPERLWEFSEVYGENRKILKLIENFSFVFHY